MKTRILDIFSKFAAIGVIRVVAAIAAAFVSASVRVAGVSPISAALTAGLPNGMWIFSTIGSTFGYIFFGGIAQNSVEIITVIAIASVRFILFDSRRYFRLAPPTGFITFVTAGGIGLIMGIISGGMLASATIVAHAASSGICA